MSAVVDLFAPAALRAVPDELFQGAHVVEKSDLSALPVLCLDLGQHMGYAYRTSACVISGAMNWTLRARDSHGHRLLRIWRWLHRIQEAAPLSLIAYEIVHHMGEKQVMAAHAWAQYQGVVEMFAARKEIPIKTIAVSTLKKAITGRGSKHPKAEGQTGSEAAKEAMMAAVMARGFAPTSHDEADALGILLWATR
ncbi:MAG: crossover junction endodeoxyribonuclease RuvC [Casimicrobiaceae bacterium]